MNVTDKGGENYTLLHHSVSQSISQQQPQLHKITLPLPSSFNILLQLLLFPPQTCFLIILQSNNNNRLLLLLLLLLYIYIHDIDALIGDCLIIITASFFFFINNILSGSAFDNATHTHIYIYCRYFNIKLIQDKLTNRFFYCIDARYCHSIIKTCIYIYIYIYRVN